jgi:SAM-dependent methyltransferase
MTKTTHTKAAHTEAAHAKAAHTKVAHCLRPILSFGFCLLLLLGTAPAIALTPNVVAPQYETKPGRADGIGKFYMGREIAQVMGHLGASWLERSSRGLEERPQLAIDAIGLKPTDVVADIGAGTGYFSFRLSQLVPQGKVLAVDVQPEMIAMLKAQREGEHITNVEPILSTEMNPNLPDRSVDVAIMVDAYHEFAYPYEMMQAIVAALKPDGRVVLLEYRGENPFVAIKPAHKMTQRQVKRELAAVGLEWVETKDDLPSQHILIFRQAQSS